MAYGAEDIAEIILTEQQISRRVAELAEQIKADYEDPDLLLVGVLTGSFVFLADLMRQLDRPCEVDFCHVSSYGNGTVSSGEFSMIRDLSLPVTGKHVLLIEDIVDSGRTVAELRRLLEARDAASVKVCTLLSKTARRETTVALNYIGFEIPDRFVVGYGLDHAQRFRNLPFIATLTENDTTSGPE